MTSTQGQLEVTTRTPSPICDVVGKANECEVVVGGDRCMSLVDSGSMITSVGEDFYKEHLKDRFPLQELNNLLQVEGAGGHVFEYRGFIEVDIVVPDHGDSPLWVPVLVAPTTAYNQRIPMIIGTNVLRNLLPNESNDVWSLATRAVSAQESQVQDSAVYCLRQIAIAPNRTVDFKGRVGTRSKMDCGVLQPADSLPGGILMIRAAVEPDESHNVPVMLKNVTSRTIEIPARQKVAWLQSATILETSGTESQLPALDEIKEIPVDLDKDVLTDDEEVEKVKEMLLKWKDVFASTSTWTDTTP